MATIPIYSPQTPFLGMIPGGFLPSFMIRVKGKMISKRGRFVIDFINTPALKVDQDIMFHMSIRMDEKVIVRNSFKNRRWEMEERYGAFRISYKDPFEIVILAEHAHYKIAVNGVHLGVFRHRLPLNLVQYIHVKGDVQIDHILLEQDVKSAQEQAALGQMINNAIMGQNASSTYRIGSSQVLQPTSTYVVSSTTRAYPVSSTFPGATVYQAPTTALYPVQTATVYQPPTGTVYQAQGPPAYQAQGPPLHQAQGPHLYPILPGQPVGTNSQAPVYPQQQTFASAPPPPEYQQNAYAATADSNDPPPPYQSNAPQQQNQVWLATPFFQVERQPNKVVFKTKNSENSLKL
ncbi:galectin-4-like [Chironomus tepperi]|uniref:galectin-4-like n=1 Tax=Chironomus tepperi TaxID=113505 RepID=UPI00391EEEE7